PAPIRSYNLEVLKALHRKWGGHRQRAQIKLPYPDQLSVGQPFEVISTFRGYPEPFLAGLDYGSMGLDLGSLPAATVTFFVTGNPTSAAAVFAGAQGLSLIVDGVSVGYVFVYESPQEGVRKYAGNVGQEVVGNFSPLELNRGKELARQVGGGINFVVGSMFDMASIIDQWDRGTQITVKPLPNPAPIPPNECSNPN
ncbi:MAG: hypothetical protein GY797_38470, partial [Deltaproteobacteria bacterium]|nr:hypothetical protein [Deltaproteobacteria bacterium]